MSHNRFPIQMNGSCGYIDREGNVVIEPVYYYCFRFSEGLARVQAERGGPYQFIDTSGKTVIEHDRLPEDALPKRLWSRADEVSYGDFSEGLAKIHVADATGLSGYINRKGELVIPPMYIASGHFSEGLAWVTVPGRRREPSKIQALQRDGTPSIVLEDIGIASGFCGGLARLLINDRTGYLDRDGYMQIPSDRFSHGGDFTSSIASVRLTEGKWCYINKMGELLFDKQFDFAEDFHAGVAYVAFEDKAVLIDQCGNIVKEIAFSPDQVAIHQFSDGMTLFELYEDRVPAGQRGPDFGPVNKRFGYFDTKGEIVIEPRFKYAVSFRDGLAMVATSKERGYINMQGDFVWSTSNWD